MISGIEPVSHSYAGLIGGFGLDITSIELAGRTGLVVGTKNLAVQESAFEGRGTYDVVLTLTTPSGDSQRMALPKVPEFNYQFGETFSYQVALDSSLASPGEYGVKVEAFLGSGEQSSLRVARLAVV